MSMLFVVFLWTGAPLRVFGGGLIKGRFGVDPEKNSSAVSIEFGGPFLRVSL